VIESFVDLTYRGLSLGRRVKLTQVRPSTGYLEHPTPMPVGTPLAITTDEGLTFDVLVMYVHEQVGGSDRAPGMTIKPTLADEKLATWWQGKVTLPEQDVPRRIERSRPITVRPRTHTVPNPMPAEPAVVVAAQTSEATMPIAIDVRPPEVPAAGARIEVVKVERPRSDTAVDEKQTKVMDAVDQELLEQLTRSPDEIEQLVRVTGEHDVVDDGKRTTLMDVVDVSALGLEVTASGSMQAVSEDDEDGGGDDAAAPNGNGDKQSKKRKKKR
jgi:hypothetical protein